MIKNPVLSGFHADPSLLYVDGTFYIANSTFEYFPGVKISKSTDLANWETVCYPLDRDSLLNMEGNPRSCGIWAPCLTFDNGMFYLVYTDVKSWADGPFKDTPNYITTAKNIEGPWSDPVYINCSGFDPSLFHDTDGRKYFVSMEWDYRKTGAEQFSGILVTELDPVSLKPIKEPVKVFLGSERGLVEGPHMYRIGEYYYLFTAEGGTTYEHAETVARSKNLFGPYEMHPNTHLVCTEDFPNAPIQKTGHGAMVQSSDGRFWFACLCGRPIGEHRRCPLGRETSINEVIWENDWPYLKNKTTLVDLEFEGYGEKIAYTGTDYKFTDKNFWLDFQSVRSKSKAEVTGGGALRIFGGNAPTSNFEQNLLVRRQTDFNFTATTSFQLYGKSFQKMAGLVYRYDEYTNYFLRVAYDEEKQQNCLGLLSFIKSEFSMPISEIPVGNGTVYLKLTVKASTGTFAYSLDGETYTDIQYTVDATTLSDEFATPLGFTGAFVGMNCVDICDKTAYADFYSFSYRVD